ncbi:leucine--tRNA ligase [Candidatus Campbellbacteria bacterium RIFOXYC2_FULL_35_25]|uniref:Leucine--tRNA ligase n=1 Tax=Candidatus Campbellbacteria bacterium RIFOXYC2_FULL_35_25 TaxID=1797582 RepID=A0A1F5EJ67_9BACT|nr:MAG: leucine--tRNA ligase [Candidatus Campbellbacteria bacterium RIFOXYC2_FULL_35_25]
MEKYNHNDIEGKWQKIWEENKVSKIDKDDTKNKFYMLDMFPYPSGDGLHMGHTESYTASDVYYRFKKMQGFNVLHPQGFDAFGLPAENFAIKTGVHPAQTTEKNISNYIKQMKMLGLNYDFDEQAVTSDPKYYKWTQWIFQQFYKNDLVYQSTQKANWCSSCQTVIANEQVLNGECERCGTQIEQKKIPGWFFKITDFADDLINDLDKVDWPEHTKKNQRNWIGKSEGAKIKFKLTAHRSQLTANEIEVFTTRPDTLFGATYMVLAPEHSLVSELKDQITNWDEVEEYGIKAQNKTEMERIEGKEKTGVKLEGISAINPANSEEIPVFIADYVLVNYGTGAIMAVPAHDDRDLQFALQKDIEIKPVIAEVKSVDEIIPGLAELKIKSARESGFATIGFGLLMESGQFNGMNSEEAKKKITEFVGGEMTTNYRLRDWSISRQRYWGCPIPIVYSPEGKATLVPEEHLPWILPIDVDFKPKGVSPLGASKEFKERTEKIFGKGWTPEYDTMDTFVDSSWYFLRYPDALNDSEFCSEIRKKWLPVDLYIGGAEHTYMHLLFARFFTKAMNKIGLLDFDEPFLKLRHQGMVLDAQGKKMSKSKGNVVNPDDMVKSFGADSVRTYMLFAAPLEDEVMWNEDNIVGVYRFLEKVWFTKDELKEKSSEDVVRELHKTIKRMTKGIDELAYNTAVSDMMKFINTVKKSSISKEDYQTFLTILSPFAPHITQELWHQLGNESLIQDESWPKFDESLSKDSIHKIAVQVNGKVRETIEIEEGTEEEDVSKKALASELIKKWLEGKEPKKIIYVKNRILNIVVESNE